MTRPDAKLGAEKAGSNRRAELVGRASELRKIEQVLTCGRNLLIEGPVGVGKTCLALHALSKLGLGFDRIDGDSRYTEQKLTGWFDPPQVLKQGYVAQCFIDGPLVSAMRSGHVLFINELNRMPESVQNILLPAMDERRIVLPKLGIVEAAPGFNIIGTQNPREFTATHSLSEALLDRFELLRLDYQARDEELAIVHAHTDISLELAQRVIDLIRATRQHPAVKRGASIRAGIGIAELLASGMSWADACGLALPTRIELVSSTSNAERIVEELALPHATDAQKKKGG